MKEKKSHQKLKNINGIPSFLAAHDSCTGLLLALSAHLKGEKTRALDSIPSNEVFASLINSLPVSWRKAIYSHTGKFSATSPHKLREINLDEVDKWVCELYPQKKYPAIAIGSSNGALVHLFAAMGIPWLPQTFLMSIDKEEKFPIDYPKPTLEWAKEPAEKLLRENPDWQLHHMMDPVQDRLKVDKVAYFRVKKTSLGEHYKKFIADNLSPDGKIIVVDCSFQWPVKKVSNRHYFQFGGAGGLDPAEYYEGSQKTKEFLSRMGKGVQKWNSPKPDSKEPEAEWGFEKKLMNDIEDFLFQKDMEGMQIIFEHPQAMSSIIANVFRKWYQEQDLPSNRLLVETFNVISPFSSLQKSCIPYWLFFNVESAAEDLEIFVNNSEKFEEIYMMILSHGKKSIGYTPASHWESIMEKATNKHSFIGTNPEKYPVDLAFYSRYEKKLEKLVSGTTSHQEKMGIEFGLNLIRKYSQGEIKLLPISQ